MSRWSALRGLCLGALAGLALLASGCGGSTSPSVASVATATSSRASGANAAGGEASSGSSGGQPQSAALKYARCMRANGEPTFPDPNSSGGFQIEQGTGVDPASTAFKAARAKCEKLLPDGGLAPGSTTHPTPQWLAQMVKVAQCMREHGVPGFPDPATTVPSDPSKVLPDGGVISDIDGVIFVFPAPTVDTQSPAFVQAAKTCGFPLHNH